MSLSSPGTPLAPAVELGVAQFITVPVYLPARLSAGCLALWLDLGWWMDDACYTAHAGWW